MQKVRSPCGSADLRGTPAEPGGAQWRSALRERFASASSLSWSMWAWATMTSMVENMCGLLVGSYLMVCPCLTRPGFARRFSYVERANAGGVGATLRVQTRKAPGELGSCVRRLMVAYRPKRVGFGLVGFVPGSAVVEVGPVNCGSPPVDLGLCLGAVAGLVELVNDLLVGERGFKDVCWGGRELGVQVAPPQHGLDLVIKTHATVGS